MATETTTLDFDDGVGGVRLWAQADRDVWEQAFPGEVTS